MRNTAPPAATVISITRPHARENRHAPRQVPDTSSPASGTTASNTSR